MKEKISKDEWVQKYSDSTKVKVLSKLDFDQLIIGVSDESEIFMTQSFGIIKENPNYPEEDSSEEFAYEEEALDYEEVSVGDYVYFEEVLIGFIPLNEYLKSCEESLKNV